MHAQTPMTQPLTPEQMERYSRQILLREIGGKGQRRLLDATVFILGAGGLGSPVALYLAAAGVGHLIIADHDVVDLSNLQRQILHNTPRLGMTKTASAAQTLATLNPDCRVTPLAERITATNVDAAIAPADLVVDGSDGFATRYLLNAACGRKGKTLISGSVLGFEGQVAVFRHGVDANAPCYRCLFPEPPAGDHAPTCATAGVLGPVTGVIGSMMAVETMKELLGIGHGLAGRLLLCNLLDGVIQTLTVPKQMDCPVCGGR